MNTNDLLLKTFTKVSVSDLVGTSQGNFQMVWIQGFVGNVATDRTQITIKDRSSDKTFVTVSNCDKVPRGLPNTVTTGEYIQVLGEVKRTTARGTVEVKATKIVHITEDVLKAAWPLELQELKLLEQGSLTFAT